AEQEGDWIRVKGRRSETANIGGEKVHPAEVESVIETMDGVTFAVVSAIPNPVLGQALAVTVHINTGETPEEFRPRLRKFCQERLPRHMTPQKIDVSYNDITTLKKKRSA
ncbi:MAG: long-chain fatty acid--CoA ligase, partial [bacterium]